MADRTSSPVTKTLGGSRKDGERIRCGARAKMHAWQVEKRSPDCSYLQPHLRLDQGPAEEAQRDRGPCRSDHRLKNVADALNPCTGLITTILDHQQAPAQELAALYHERWEIETTLDESKTHPRGAQIVLRSKTPELVQHELFGLLMAHSAIRGLMHEAALKAR